MNTIDANNADEPDVSAELPSVDEFIKQLEEREKDLDISSDLVIEVGDSEVEHENIHNTFAPTAESPVKTELDEEDLASKEAAILEKAEDRIKESQRAFELQLSKMETERDDARESLRRQKNDFENYRKRTERERQEMFIDMVGRLATQTLPVLDNLNRALDSSNLKEEMTPKEARDFVDGIFLVNQQLNEVFAGMGVEVIESLGKEFDPNIHEAVATEETDEHPPKTVLAELLRGYKVGQKVIRASMVKVSTSPSVKTDSNADELILDEVFDDEAEGY